MRHRLRARLRVAVALALAGVLLLTGCGKPGGVDGTITDDWAPVAAPTGFTPRAGVCHLASFAEVGPRAAYEEIECALQHRTETVHVGAYPRPAAEASAPPAPGSAGARAAYRDCDERTTAYVGGPWRAARLWIGVVHPTASAWTGGARWYRCDVQEITSVEDDGGVVQRIGTLRGALKKATSPLWLTCYAIKLSSAGAIDTMPAATCASKHNAEFVGLWDAGDSPYPTEDEHWKKFHDACRRKIASYVGVPVDADLEFRTGVVSLPGGEDVWAAGDHAVRCYLWLDSAELTASLKGRGAKALPVQYE